MIEMGLIRKETPNCTRVVRNLELSCFFPKKFRFQQDFRVLLESNYLFLFRDNTSAPAVM